MRRLRSSPSAFRRGAGGGAPQGSAGDGRPTARGGPRCALELLNVVRRLYHFGRSVSDLARACRLMGEGAYDRLHADWDTIAAEVLGKIKHPLQG